MERVCHKVFSNFFQFCSTFTFFKVSSHFVPFTFFVFYFFFAQFFVLSSTFHCMLPHRFNIPTIREFYGSTEGTYGTINIRNKEVGHRWKRDEHEQELKKNNQHQKQEVDLKKNTAEEHSDRLNIKFSIHIFQT